MKSLFPSLSHRITMCSAPLLTMFAIIAGCGPDESKPKVSEAELEQRQDNTVDVAGTYQERADGTGAALTIENESRPFDIRTHFSLHRTLTDSEHTRIKSSIRQAVVRITEEELTAMITALEKAMGNVTIGEGRQFKDRGGENIALDGAGKISEIIIESGMTKFYDSTYSGSVEEFHYQLKLSLSAYRDQPLLDYRTTRNTDRESLRSDNTKGMSLTLWRRVYNGDSTTQYKLVTDRMPLALEGFTKK